MRRRRASAATLALAAAPLLAQRVPEVRTHASEYKLAPLSITTTVSLVTVDVVVRDQNGNAVAGLSRDNFTVLDEGHIRPLTAFAVSTRERTVQAQPAPAATTSAAAAPAPKGAAARATILFFDDVNTDAADLAHARNAALRFIREALHPGDRVALATASGRGELDFTRDRSPLATAIAAISAHPRQNPTGFVGCPRITPYQAYLIVNHIGPMALQAAEAEKIACDKRNGLRLDPSVAVYNGENPDALNGGTGGIPGADNESEQVIAKATAVWAMAEQGSRATLEALLTSVAALEAQSGTRTLLLASGGFLDGGVALPELQDQLAQAALHAGVVINALDARGLYTTSPARGLDEIPETIAELPLPTFFFEQASQFSQQMTQEEPLAELAESTGGLLFHDNNDLTTGFQRLGLVPAVSYGLAFTAAGVPHDGKYHKLKVALTPKCGCILQYRPGYFAPPPADAGLGLQQRVDAAMRATGDEDGLPASVACRSGTGAVTVEFRLDARRLPFASSHGRHRLDLTFIAGLFGADGRYRSGKQAEMDMALQDATWKKMQATGLNANLTLRPPAGHYRLRVVIVESTGGHVFATSQPVRVR
ncbi:MAG: VWA domain-containing protein [Terriglobales bacterium]